MKSYNKQPSYIKLDDEIVRKIIDAFNKTKISESELLFLPMDKIIEHLNLHLELIKQEDMFIYIDDLSGRTIAKIIRI